MIDQTLTPDEARQNPPHQDEATRLAWYRLRLLGLGHTAGWYEYAAGDQRRSVLRLPESPDTPGRFTRWREIHRSEIRGWVRGVADAANDDHTGDAWNLEPSQAATPYMLTTTEAAAALGIKESTVDYRYMNASLYPVYVQRRNAERYAIWPQIADQLDLPGWSEEWQRIRSTLPPLTRVEQLTSYPGPVPSGPLPYRNERRIGQQMEALTIADAEGWCAYVHGDGRDDGRYTIEVPAGPDHVTTRILTGDDVLPYVLGLADWHGHPELVAYRDGLG